jgi:hypothetical protein
MGAAFGPLLTLVTSTRAKVGGHPPTEVKEEGWPEAVPGDMEWEGARRPWHARSSRAGCREQMLASDRNRPTAESTP